MRYRIENWTFRDAVRSEWRSAMRPFREHKLATAVGLGAAFVVVSVVMAIRVDADLSDIPVVALAGLIQVLRWVFLFSLLWFGVVAYLVHGYVSQMLEQDWCQREAAKRPGESFTVPFWRFWSAGVVAATALFLGVTVPLAYLLYGLPQQLDGLQEALAVFDVGDSDWTSVIW